jgi:chemotaxis protein methyltransferase CheR
MNTLVEKTNHDKIAETLSRKIGLRISTESWSDLEKKISLAAPELGFNDIYSMFEWLETAALSQKQVQILANYLTIGETYFFREKASFDILKDHIIPEIIDKNRKNDKKLRIWSAGCCTGEEPYSIAIILKQMIQDIADWNIKLLATDINQNFLNKAANGIYSSWAFRETFPEIIKKFFQSKDDKCFKIDKEIQKMVKFSNHNLVENIYPVELNKIDVIFCRNVLMYFTQEQAVKVIKKFYQALNDAGYLIVSPVEATHSLFPQFTLINAGGAIIFRKGLRPSWAKECLPPQLNIQNVLTNETIPVSEQIPVINNIQEKIDLKELKPFRKESSSPDLFEEGISLYKKGNYEKTIELFKLLISHGRTDYKIIVLLSHCYANLGNLAEAQKWCEKAIEENKIDASNYYLLATILQEQNEVEKAEQILKQVIYLDQTFVLAFFALGNIARSQGKSKIADKYFKSALRILENYSPEMIIPGSDIITAGSLKEIIILLL